MVLVLASALSIAARCAPDVAPDVLLSVAHVESHFEPLAVDINHGPIVHPRTLDAAISVATRYIQAGYSVDLGIAQINSHNLARLGLSIADTFDPCTNMRAAQKLLLENYDRARRQASGDNAIALAFSYYNSGSATVGYRNGYVGKVFKAAQQITPKLRSMSFSRAPEGQETDAQSVTLPAEPQAQSGNAAPPSQDTALDWFISGTAIATANIPQNETVMIFK